MAREVLVREQSFDAMRAGAECRERRLFRAGAHPERALTLLAALLLTFQRAHACPFAPSWFTASCEADDWNGIGTALTHSSLTREPVPASVVKRELRDAARLAVWVHAAAPPDVRGILRSTPRPHGSRRRCSVPSFLSERTASQNAPPAPATLPLRESCPLRSHRMSRYAHKPVLIVGMAVLLPACSAEGQAAGSGLYRDRVLVDALVESCLSSSLRAPSSSIQCAPVRVDAQGRRQSATSAKPGAQDRARQTQPSPFRAETQERKALAQLEEVGTLIQGALVLMKSKQVADGEARDLIGYLTVPQTPCLSDL